MDPIREEVGLRELQVDERRHLVNVAYRLLGSVTEAEDVVQEAQVRWCSLAAADRKSVRLPLAWLTTVISRICLDLLNSARQRREKYVGEWLPEPVSSEALWANAPNCAPFERAAVSESIGMAFMVMLEALTPAERIAFILHDVFEYSFGDVADVLDRAPTACRQLASSARRKLRPSSGAMSHSADPRSVQAFKTAWETRDIKAMGRLLDPDSVAIVDGGGVVSSEQKPLLGPTMIASAFMRVYERQPNISFVEASVNGESGLIAFAEGAIQSVLAFAALGERIYRIWVMRNPEKLVMWTRSATPNDGEIRAGGDIVRLGCGKAI